MFSSNTSMLYSCQLIVRRGEVYLAIDDTKIYNFASNPLDTATPLPHIAQLQPVSICFCLEIFGKTSSYFPHNHLETNPEKHITLAEQIQRRAKKFILNDYTQAAT